MKALWCTAVHRLRRRDHRNHLESLLLSQGLFLPSLTGDLARRIPDGFTFSNHRNFVKCNNLNHVATHHHKVNSGTLQERHCSQVRSTTDLRQQRNLKMPHLRGRDDSESSHLCASEVCPHLHLEKQDLALVPAEEACDRKDDGYPRI